MTITTADHGDIVVELAAQTAPCTVNSFAYLAKEGFYDGTEEVREPPAHAEICGLALLQCGDPFAKADGKNPPRRPGIGQLRLRRREPGAAIPRARHGVHGPTTRRPSTKTVASSQDLFSNDTTQLDVEPAYTPFGTVVKGMEILDKIAAGGWITNPNDIVGDGGSNAPKIPVIIKDLTLSKDKDATGKGAKSAKKSAKKDD